MDERVRRDDVFERSLIRSLRTKKLEGLDTGREPRHAGELDLSAHLGHLIEVSLGFESSSDEGGVLIKRGVIVVNVIGQDSSESLDEQRLFREPARNTRWPPPAAFWLLEPEANRDVIRNRKASGGGASPIHSTEPCDNTVWQENSCRRSRGDRQVRLRERGINSVKSLSGIQRSVFANVVVSMEWLADFTKREVSGEVSPFLKKVGRLIFESGG